MMPRRMPCPIAASGHRLLGAALCHGIFAALLAFAPPLFADDGASGETPGEVASTQPVAGGGAATVETRVRVLFVGDVMLDDGPGRAIANGRDPFADFAAEFAEADLRVGNLETAIAASGEAIANKIYTFRANPQVIGALNGRFDVLSVANNHSGDYGHEAFVETLALLDIAGIRAAGGGRNLREAHAPVLIERGGLRIALLAFNEYKPRAFEAGPDWPGIAWSEDSHVVRDIRAARAAGADIVIPFMHWGWEREREPNARQRRLARLMIDAGADAVVGTHPHVTQGSETYKGKPIVYSLGNFVFDGFDAPAEREGWLLQMTLGRNGVGEWRTLSAFMDDEGLPRRQRPAVPPPAATAPQAAEASSAR